MKKYDVVVIGAGPAGLASARLINKSGKKVLVVDKDPLGGTCLNSGCIPTKFRLKEGNREGILEAQRNVVSSLNGAIEKSLKKCGIDVEFGIAKFLDEKTVRVNDEDFFSDYFIVSVGSSPRELSGFNFDGERIFSAEELLWKDVKNVGKVQIVGAGPVGIEFAFMLKDVAEEIVICEIADEILPNEDKEIASRLRVLMSKVGFNFELGKECELDKSADIVLVAVGRKSSKGMDYLFSEIQIERDEKGFLRVNEFLQTSIPNIYAAGECCGKKFFANTAAFEGKIAARNVLGEKVALNYPAIPRCVFSNPPVASVGEQNEGLKYGSVNFPHGEMYYIYPFAGKLKVGVDSEGIVKFMSMVGPNASEILPLFNLAIEERLHFERVRNLLYVHPTLCEAIGRIRLS